MDDVQPHPFDVPANPPLYPGEDTRSTSKKELAGWYSYGWAAEVRDPLVAPRGLLG